MLKTSTLSVSTQIFWDNEMFPYLKSLKTGIYVFPEIQNIYDSYQGSILARYHTDATIYPKDGPLQGILASGEGVAAMSSEVVAGWFPSIHICVPVWSRIFFEVQSSDRQRFRRIFEATFVTGLLHEQIHLGFGLVPLIDSRMSISHMLDSERIAWGHTCDVMRLFKGRGIRILDSMNSYDLKWEACGRDNNSRSWKEYIRKMHCAQ